MLFFFVTGPGGVEGLLDQISRVKAELVVLGVAVTLAGLCLDAIAWRILLRSMNLSASIPDTMETYFASFAWGLLGPSFTAVEIYVRISLAKKRFFVKQENRPPSTGELFSSILLHRLLGLLAYIPLSIPVAYGLVVLLDLDRTAGLLFVLFISLLALLAVSFIALIYVKPNLATGVLGGVISIIEKLIPPYKKISDSHRVATQQFVRDYTVNLRLLARQPLATSKAFILALLNAICGFAGAAILVYAAGGSAPIWAILVIVFVSGTINLIPLGIPGMEGFKETVITSLYRKYESFSKAGVISLLNSFSTFYVPVVVGIAYAIIGNKKQYHDSAENDSRQE